MPYFHYILLIDTSNQIQEITSIITLEREHTAKRKLLEWVDCTVKHESTREQRQRTTGEWLFKEDLYIEWRKCSFGLLWLSGKAGAGKSVLASAIINSLSSGLADNETLASFYCDFRTPRSMHTMEILRSLTMQLLWNSKIDWLSSFPELVMCKECAAKLHQRPMIVIDALDECEDLSKLLGELVKLDKACRLFVTSRPLHSINGAFGGLPSISLNDKIDAVCSDMHFHISTELESRDRLKILSHGLQVEIWDALLKKADGMFRWVQCQLDRLNGCWSLGDLRSVLDTLPTTLYETYERMLCAIDKKEFGGRVAQRALVWLVTALDSLTLSELADALKTSIDNPASDSTFATMYETDIIEICSSLVSFDERTGWITLSHYSVKEYLTSDIVTDKTYFVHDAHANFELAVVCMAQRSCLDSFRVAAGAARCAIVTAWSAISSATLCITPTLPASLVLARLVSPAYAATWVMWHVASLPGISTWRTRHDGAPIPFACWGFVLTSVVTQQYGYFAARLVARVCARSGAAGFIQLHGVVTRWFGTVEDCWRWLWGCSG
ncbi:hypothetical protein BU15DRAFT_83672 [Melanogaster broomeanus]|nr:hypothetical protein BU15DRAFT_83672 [Melanogaster broomeanus]